MFKNKKPLKERRSSTKASAIDARLFYNILFMAYLHSTATGIGTGQGMGRGVGRVVYIAATRNRKISLKCTTWFQTRW